jgi:hypothetical protein
LVSFTKSFCSCLEDEDEDEEDDGVVDMVK